MNPADPDLLEPDPDASTATTTTTPTASDADESEDRESDEARRWAERGPGHFPVVAVGAGAGGIDAFIELLEGLPATLGLAIVLITDDGAGGEALARQLAPSTTMPVACLAGTTTIAQDHVYVMPSGLHASIDGWAVTVVPRPADSAAYTPIDNFMGALARAVHSCAIGLLLAGTGSDGVLGLREVKASGGFTIVQDPETARHQGAPRAAIIAGVADLVLAPHRIVDELQRIGRHPYVRHVVPRRAGDDLVILQEQMHRIFAMLRTASGVDFTHYKLPTIRRRLQRRMVLHKLDSVDLYIKHLRENPEEISKLYQDLLIHVTRFFRDPESFRAMVTEVFPRIVQARRGMSPIRIWLPGCSTGEEAYSVAIAFLEFLGDEASAVGVQIFATDVSETAIEHARNGLYPDSIAGDLTPERLRRFFTRTDGKYRISKVVRDLCVFARQDVTRDPPFSKLDLILCRNVLIYLGAVLQRKLMNVFHYALKTGGFLMLGGAETVGAQADLFTVIDKKHRIFVKKEVDSPASFNLPMEYAPGRVPGRARPVAELQPGANFLNEANRQILDRYGPPGVIVDSNFQIIQFRGKTGAFLEPAPGEAAQSLNVLKMARDGLLHGLQTALYAARKSEAPVRKTGLRVQAGGLSRDVDVQVVPLTVTGESRHYLVLFEDVTREDDPSRHVVAANSDPREDDHIRQLQDELAAGREYLQSIIQDLEAANEELQSANEEILSSNEELQSTNEELDTAKEELQSTNEELNTVNEELHGRNDELSRVNSDLVNLLGCVEIAIVIVGNDLSIRRFTPMAEKVLNLIPTDIGRPISQIKPNIEYPGLEQMIARVIDTVTIQELNVGDGKGNWYSLRIRPYKNVENRIDGAVLALFDISRRRHELELRQASDNIRAIIETSDEPILLLDGQHVVQFANHAFLRGFELAAASVLHRRVFEIPGGPWHLPTLRDLLDDALPRLGRLEGVLLDYHVSRDGPAEASGPERRRLRLNASRVPGFEPSATLVILAVTDLDPEPLAHEHGTRA